MEETPGAGQALESLPEDVDVEEVDDEDDEDEVEDDDEVEDEEEEDAAVVLFDPPAGLLSVR